MSDKIILSADESVKYFRIETNNIVDNTTLKPRICVTFSLSTELVIDQSSIHGMDTVIDGLINQLKPGLIKVLSE